MTNVFKYGDITYQDLKPIDKQAMAASSVKADAWLEAATTAQLTPITALEFRRCCVSFPIVFAPSGKAMPIAIMSFTPGKNPFISDKQWREDTYIPAALRRYPFALAEADNEGKRLLCVDGEILAEGSEGDSLFTTEGENTDLLNNALKLCQEYDKHIKGTDAAIDAIEDAGLFVERQLTITAPDGTERKTGVFKMVDSEKYDTLSDEQILTLQRAQALWLIHAHMISMDQVKTIAAIS